MTLREEWQRVSSEGNDLDSWEPRRFDPADPADWDTLGILVGSGRIRELHDTIESQLEELAETRLPKPADKPRRAGLARDLLGGKAPDRYGRWIFYPWSGRLVHVLPEAEFRELRTSRNAYKITPQEQEKLRTLKLGVLGLSVGHATAVTLALEEIGGEYRLADFDRLSLSNMNRLHARVDGIGTRKAVLTARTIFELNPYARVRLFPEGLDDSNLDAFLTGGGALDLLFEECDDLFMKVFVRERARELRIPVLMETSDRGLIDVERFDLEPERPLLHGLIGNTRAEELRGLPTADKVPFVLDILGTRTISERFAASLYEIDRTLRTWPQLASGVALGGALTTDVARRIALGKFRESGRYYVDLEQLVADGRTTRPEPSPRLPQVTTPAPVARRIELKHRLSENEARELARLAALAPSGGNVQPWLFEHSGNALLVRWDPRRSGSVLDFERRGTFVALGAAAENFRIAAAAAGFRARIEELQDPADPTLVCRLSLEGPGEESAGRLFDRMCARVTNRRRAPAQALTPAQRQAIEEAAERAEAFAELVTDREAVAEIGRIFGAGDRLRYMNESLGPEAAHELRWTDEEVASGDGLDVRSLEVSATDLAGARLTGERNGLALLEKWNLGSSLEEGAQKSFEACSGVLLVSVEGSGARAHFRGGRALESIWIAAEAAGLAVQPYTALVYFFLRLELGDASAFTAPQQEALRELRRRYRRVFTVPAERTEFMLLRLAHAPPPTTRSLRRPIEQVFRPR